MGHGAAAGEGQEDSAEDQTFQDETSAEGAPLCRCKAVWMRLFVCVPSLCVHETYLVIGYEQVCVFNRKSVCVFRAFTSMLCVCVRGCLIDSLCSVCVGRHICVHRLEFSFFFLFLLAQSIQQRCLCQIPDGEWALKVCSFLFSLPSCLSDGRGAL